MYWTTKFYQTFSDWDGTAAAKFPLSSSSGALVPYEWCDLHGVWRGTNLLPKQADWTTAVDAKDAGKLKAALDSFGKTFA